MRESEGHSIPIERITAEEKLEPHALYTVIYKFVRVSSPEKPGRDLFSVQPRSTEILSNFHHCETLRETLYPNQQAGHHRHQKQEIMTPDNNKVPLFVFLQDFNNPQLQEFFYMVARPRDKVVAQYHIHSDVVHAVYNHSLTEFASYLILADALEENALARGDVKDVRLDIDQFVRRFKIDFQEILRRHPIATWNVGSL